MALGIVLVAAAVAVPLGVVDRTVAGTPVAAVEVRNTPPTNPEPIVCAGAEQLVASGSALAGAAVSLTIERYQEACPGNSVVYDPVGTGAGIQEFLAGTTDMAVTDRPLRADELTVPQCDVLQLPLVVHPVTIPYRLSGVDDLTMDGPTIAKIFSGAITVWNDPAIAALNPGAQLPAVPITVVSRSDESIETATFQHYLAVAGGWTGGTDTTFTGASGVAAQGSDGMLQLIAATEGAIGYLTARDGTRSQVLLIEGSAPEPDAVAKTINAALPAEGLTLSTTELYAADGAYPVLIVSYAVVCDENAAARNLILSSLTAQGGETTFLLPTGEWANRLVNLLQ